MSSLPPRPEQNLDACHHRAITIRHDRQHGTLIYGTVRGDGAGKILYRYNFRPSDWLPDDDELGAAYWYVPHSRRRSADRWKLEKVTAALEKAGFTVEVRVDNTTPATGFDDLEAERYERADTRAARYRRKAGAADTQSDAIRADNQRTYDALAGTPILIGHYSETRHRNLLDRLWKREGKAWQLYDQAKQWRSKAQSAERFQHRRQDVGTTQRRIAKLEARLRQIGRTMDGSTELLWDNPTGWPGPLQAQLDERFASNGIPVTILATKDNDDGIRNVAIHIGVSEQTKAELAAEVVEITEEIGYWQMVIEASGVKTYTKADVAKGDFVKIFGRWFEVLKVNAKSVTVPDRFAPDTLKIQTFEALAARFRHPGTTAIPFDEINGVITRQEAEQQFPAAFATLLEGERLPKRTSAKRGKIKLEHTTGHNHEAWWFQIGQDSYVATWKTPEYTIWHGPPVPIDDPAPIVVKKANALERREPITELTVPRGIRWREDVQNVLRAWVEPWAAKHQATRKDGT